MKEMEDTKKSYENIPIPAELSKRVQLEIEKANANQKRKAIHIQRRRILMKKTAIAATAAVVLLTTGLNTSQTFAQELGGIPVVGSIARVLTFRSYETDKTDIKTSVDIPTIEMISTELDGLEKSVNKEIYAFCEQYAEEAQARAEEYRQAFLETGGTEEEWAAHDIKIKVWYDVKAFTGDYLSIAVMGTDSWSNASADAKYYTFDAKAGKWLTLSDVLDGDLKSAEENIRSQIVQKEKETGMNFWDEDWGGLTEDAKFYVNAAGNPVIVFAPYEIAPGAAGQQEFEIIK